MKITRNVTKEIMFEHIKPGECFTNGAMVLMKTLITYDKGQMKNSVNLETGFFYSFKEEQIVTRKPNANLIIGD